MTNEITVKEQIKGTLDSMKGSFQAALPDHISVEKFTRVAQTALLSNEYLLKLDRNSLFKACIDASQAGLLPDSVEGAIVPFKGKATFMPMIGGILKKIRNSGQIASITAQIVFENDEFDFWVDGNGENLKHKPLLFGDRGKELGCYAIAKGKEGETYIEVMTADQVKAVEDCSKGNNTPWKGPFRSEMVRKTVIRRLAKKLPMSTDVEMLVKADDKFYEMPTANRIENKQPMKSLEDIVTEEVI